MKFGPVPLAAAEGALLAHSVTLAKGRLKKGQVLTRDDVESLAASGVQSVIVARLEPGDVPENEAAQRLAEALAAQHLEPGNPGTGRCNLYAGAAGLLLVDADRVHRLNLVHESITLATAPPFEALGPGQIAATVKIIPFAAPAGALDQCIEIARSLPLRLAPFRPFRAGLIQTRLPGIKESVLEKTVAVTRDRLAAIGSRLAAHRTCAHAADDVTTEIRALAPTCDLLLLLGASAIIDRRDVIPTAIAAAGGTIIHFGMPVDPGNLTLLARVGAHPVLGLPGSARSPRVHGFDYVLQRLAAGLEVTAMDIMRMGVGGLLKEIAGRPLPRARAAPQRVSSEATPSLPRERGEGRSRASATGWGQGDPSPPHRPPPGAAYAAPTSPAPRGRQASARTPRIAAIILAAGRSTRMQGTNKLLADVDGKPLVRRVVEHVAAAQPAEIVVVTGHERQRTESALAGLGARFAYNPDYVSGLGTSLRAGIAALGADVEGALVCLGDMPEVSSSLVRKLIAAFPSNAPRSIVVPVRNGRRGNPIILGRDQFAAASRIEGDKGARDLIAAAPDSVVEVEIEDEGIFLDLDTPDALAAYKSNQKPNTKTPRRQGTK